MGRGRKPSLSDEDWDLLIDYYNVPHTMEECGVMFKITAQTVCRNFKKFGVKARPRLVPATPEAEARLKAGMFKTKEERAAIAAQPAPLGPPPKRRIIKFSEDESSLYEKEQDEPVSEQSKYPQPK
jgi:hypothetical protein